MAPTRFSQLRLGRRKGLASPCNLSRRFKTRIEGHQVSISRYKPKIWPSTRSKMKHPVHDPVAYLGHDYVRKNSLEFEKLLESSIRNFFKNRPCMKKIRLEIKRYRPEKFIKFFIRKLQSRFKKFYKIPSRKLHKKKA